MSRTWMVEAEVQRGKANLWHGGGRRHRLKFASCTCHHWLAPGLPKEEEECLMTGLAEFQELRDGRRR